MEQTNKDLKNSSVSSLSTAQQGNKDLKHSSVSSLSTAQQGTSPSATPKPKDNSQDADQKKVWASYWMVNEINLFQ